jgi:hypothetical protein
MPRNAEIWLDNKKLLMTDFPIENLKWGERINLMIKGDGGDTREIRGSGWRLFYEYADVERKWLKENEWNSNEKIMFIRTMVKRDYWQEKVQLLAKKIIGDMGKMKLVLEECLHLINFIGSKIEEVEISRYEENEIKEEWEYKEFGTN